MNERRFSDRMLGRTSHKEDPSAVIPNYLFPSQSRERTNRRAEILPWICLAACIGALCFSFLCYLEVSSSRDALYDGAFELAKRNARLQFEAEQLRRENSELRFHASLYQIEHGIRPKEDDALRPIESLLSIGGQGRARRRE